MRLLRGQNSLGLLNPHGVTLLWHVVYRAELGCPDHQVNVPLLANRVLCARHLMTGWRFANNIGLSCGGDDRAIYEADSLKRYTFGEHGYSIG